MPRPALFIIGSALIFFELQLAAQQTTFRSGVDLVALSVVVTDGRDKFVSGLSAEDFAVLEDGVPQHVSFFSATAVPMDLALLLDTSASMIDKMNVVHEAATGFVASAKPGDRVTIVDIKDGVRVLHPLDEDLEGARAAIRTTSARGGTALYNGLYMTLKEMVKLRRNNGEVRRQAILVLSDGDDTASLVDFDDVMDWRSSQASRFTRLPCEPRCSACSRTTGTQRWRASLPCGPSRRKRAPGRFSRMRPPNSPASTGRLPTNWRASTRWGTCRRTRSGTARIAA